LSAKNLFKINVVAPTNPKHNMSTLETIPSIENMGQGTFNAFNKTKPTLSVNSIKRPDEEPKSSRSLNDLYMPESPSGNTLSIQQESKPMISGSFRRIVSAKAIKQSVSVSQVTVKKPGEATTRHLDQMVATANTFDDDKISKIDSVVNALHDESAGDSEGIARVKRIVQFLRTAPIIRSNIQIDEIIDDYSHIGFIKKISGKLPHEQVRKILRSLRYRFLKKDEVLFRYNDIPDKAFIVFQGSVTVMVPKTEIQMERELSDKNFIKFDHICAGLDLRQFLKDPTFYNQDTGIL
jgi:hypothetical protein